MKAFRSLDDYKDFKAARVTGCLGWFPSNPGQNLSGVYLYIYTITVLMWWGLFFVFFLRFLFHSPTEHRPGLLGCGTSTRLLTSSRSTMVTCEAFLLRLS